MKRKHDREDDILGWLGINAIPNWAVAKAIGPLLTVLTLILFVLALVASLGLLLNLSFGGGTPTLGSGAFVGAILGSPFLIWGTILKHRTVSFQKEGHITDRISKATEQLGAEKTVKRQLMNSFGKKVFNKSDDGNVDHSRPVMVEESSPNIEVRVGGILSLERIAQDSTSYDGGRDHVRVMEILCAYIRENSQDHQDLPLTDWEPLELKASKEKRKAHRSGLQKRIGKIGMSGEVQEWARALPKLRMDVQLALTVIGRRTEKQRAVEAAWPEPLGRYEASPFEIECPKLIADLDFEQLRSENSLAIARQVEAWANAVNGYSGYRLDLRGANLQGADMSAKRSDGSDAVFSGALFSDAKLDGASFEHAELRGVVFKKTALNAVNFNTADLSGSIFENFCQMEAVRFINANLTSVLFSEAGMLGATFTTANLDFAKIDSSVLEAGWFLNNQARFVEFSSTKCFGLRALSIDASMAKIQKIEYGLSIFGSSNALQGAALMEMNLSNIKNVGIETELLFGDASVALPEGINPPKHWATVNIGWLKFDDEVSKWLDDPSGYASMTSNPSKT